MFLQSDPVWSAASIAERAAAEAPADWIDETFVENFLTNLIDLLTDDARQIFWRVVDGMDPDEPHRFVYATEVLRALRHVSKLGLSASAIIDEFGSVQEITLERLLLWAVEEHGHVLAD